MMRNNRAGTITSRVAMKISEEKGDPPAAVEPLYETIDPESLNNLFSGESSVTGPGLGHVQFCHADCLVTVTSDDSVTVSCLEDGP